METDRVRVQGESGPPVLLLPGGAESCDGFFPGLPEGLAADPGCRVILQDRPGTGAAADGSLADAAAYVSGLIDELGCGPVVVVGQSLGGAVAVLLAREYPEKVAGLVLLDPTPINDVRLAAQVEQTMRRTARVASIPVLGGLVKAGLRASAAKIVRRQQLRPDCAEAQAKIGQLDIPQLGRAVEGLTELAKSFEEVELPRLPAVVVTADRKPDNKIRQAHTRLAAALGAPIVCWPGATHSVHLDHPDETLAVVRDLVSSIKPAR
ncbi:alpha/beta hydrolase [Kribbella sp. NPDC056861]|uniref:alpha/beta fold hydrolase n=1 Tax=Kribbella sp. NPDC056861 TaxID=3154857 RepID=UPI00341D0DE7